MYKPIFKQNAINYIVKIFACMHQNLQVWRSDTDIPRNDTLSSWIARTRSSLKIVWPHSNINQQAWPHESQAKLEHWGETEAKIKKNWTVQTQREVRFEAIDSVQLWRALKERLAFPNDTAVAFTHLDRYLYWMYTTYFHYFDYFRMIH